MELVYSLYIRRRYVWMQLEGQSPHKLGALVKGHLDFFSSKVSQFLDDEDVDRIKAAFESRKSPEDYTPVGSVLVVALPDEKHQEVRLHVYGTFIGYWLPREWISFSSLAHPVFRKDHEALYKLCRELYAGIQDNIFNKD